LFSTTKWIPVSPSCSSTTTSRVPWRLTGALLPPLRGATTTSTTLCHIPTTSRQFWVLCLLEWCVRSYCTFTRRSGTARGWRLYPLTRLAQVLSWICILLRLYTRYFISRAPGWDDLFIGLYLVRTKPPSCSRMTCLQLTGAASRFPPQWDQPASAYVGWSLVGTSILTLF